MIKMSMDNYSEGEIESIWKRVKRQINVDKIKARTPEDLAVEIEKEMLRAGDTGKQGSLGNLLRAGFSDRVIRIDSVVQEFREPLPGVKPKVRVKRFTKSQLPSSNLRITQTGRISVKTSTRTRTFAQKNIRITIGSFKGRASYYVFNTRTKKRVSWGFVE